MAKSLLDRFDSDPKPEKPATAKLSGGRSAWSSGTTPGGHEGGEEGTFRRADSAGLAPGGEWHTGRRHLPRAWHQRGDLLHLEKEVLGFGPERVARTAAVARG